MKLLLIFIFVSSLGVPLTFANSVKFAGSAKSYLIAGDHDLVGDDGGKTNFSWFTFLRGNAFYTANARNSFELTYQFASQWGETETQTDRIPDFGYRWDDVNNHPSLPVEDNVKFWQNLDRLIWNHSMSDIDFFWGRQEIQFGSGRMANPTDVFTPFPIATINTEYRYGVDALRVKISLGKLGEFDGGVVLGEDGNSDQSAFYGRFIIPLKKIDIAATLINYQENWLAGLDLQGKVLNQKVWLEAAYNKMREYKNEEKSYTRFVTGAEYKFSKTIIGHVEYQFNGAGTESEVDYNTNADSLAYREGGVFFLAKNYLGTGIVWLLKDKWTYRMSQIGNMEDHSNFIKQDVSWNFSENFYMDLISYMAIGASDTEFDRYTNLGMFALRGYF